MQEEGPTTRPRALVLHMCAASARDLISDRLQQEEARQLLGSEQYCAARERGGQTMRATAAVHAHLHKCN